MNDISVGDINKSLWKKFKQHNYHIENTYFFNWESDFFCISKAGYMYEFEIKLSYADFKADFRKTDKHLILEKDNIFVKKGYEQVGSYIERKGYTNKVHYNEINKEQTEKSRYKVYRKTRTNISFVNPIKCKPHKFIYVCPNDIIPLEEIPDYAGLMYFSKNKNGRGSLRYIKQPPFLHKEKWDEDKLNKKLLYKIYWSYRNLREYKYGLR